MKFIRALIAALFAFSQPAPAEVELRVSIKVILGPAGEWPDNTATVGTTGLNLNSETVLRDNITFANTILARHATGFRLVLRENQIYTLSGLNNFWFTANARLVSTRDQLEAAALEAKPFWKWHDDSINIYLNDSSSGVCSFPGSNLAIIAGAGAYQELLIHEIGHFLNLRHTHSTADDNEPLADNSVDDWADGDGFPETLADDKNATAAQINAQYDGVPAVPGGVEAFVPQEIRNDLIFNIMSYHQPQDRFVWQQREMIVETFNGSRSFVANGRARFVQSDGNNAADGLTMANRLATIGQGVNLSNNPADVVLIRGGGYNAAAEGLPLTLNTPLTLAAWRGPVTITRPP